MIGALDSIAPHAATVTLATCRFAGFVLASPIPGAATPTGTRVGLCVVLGLVTGLFQPAPELALDARLVGSVAIEVALGALVGFVLRLALFSADVVGGALSAATGLSIASVLDPHQEAHETPASRVTSLFALAVAFAVGAHRAALAYLLESFRALPVGTPVHLERGVGELFAFASSALVLGARLAMPIAAIALTAQAGLAIVARTAPALQLFNLGVAVLVVLGFGALFASAPDFASGVTAALSEIPARLDRVLFEIRP